jgi:hypothetical protein
MPRFLIGSFEQSQLLSSLLTKAKMPLHHTSLLLPKSFMRLAEHVPSSVCIRLSSSLNENAPDESLSKPLLHLHIVYYSSISLTVLCCPPEHHITVPSPHDHRPPPLSHSCLVSVLPLSHHCPEVDSPRSNKSSHHCSVVGL